MQAAVQRIACVRMEAQPTQPPLKVCPHCSVATRTDAEACPNCGRSYVRGPRLPRLRWSWWFAIPIVAAAFLVGYFGISQLIDDDESAAGAITLEQAQELPGDVSRSEVEERLGEPAVERPQRGNPGATCLFYSITDQPDTLWQFCFRRDELVSSTPISG